MTDRDCLWFLAGALGTLAFFGWVKFRRPRPEAQERIAYRVYEPDWDGLEKPQIGGGRFG